MLECFNSDCILLRMPEHVRVEHTMHAQEVSRSYSNVFIRRYCCLSSDSLQLAP